MHKNKRNIIVYCTTGLVSIIVGLVIYLLYRRETYIAQFILPKVFTDNQFNFANRDFIKFYFVDYLWGFSLSCGLHAIINPMKSGTLICTFVVFICGLIYEIFQYTDIIKGTGDMVDILLYLLAGLSVNIIFYLLKEK